MKHLLKGVMVCLAGFFLMTPSAALAQSVRDDAVEALRDSAVYVAPGTEGTTTDTAGVLLGRLNDGDRLLIVMLPSGALDGTEQDPTEFAASLDEALGGEHIVGLSVGEQSVAYSAILPSGVATDLMTRADSVSSTAEETLGTFIQNVHSWQRNNPQEEAASPDDKSDGGGLPILVFVAVVASLVFIGVAIFAFVRSRTNVNDGIRYRSPDQVSDVLRDLMALRLQVQKEATRDLIRQIVSDTEAYFKRASKEGRKEDAATFRRHLDSIKQVLERYIDIQGNHRFYDDPAELMRQGEEAFGSFAELVLNNIKRGNRRALTNYRVDTDILSATRYS